MNLFFPLIGTASCLMAISFVFIFVLRKKTQLQLIDESNVGDRTFYAVRLEGEDFLFLKEESNVNFIGSLDFEEDFKVLNLYEMKKDDEKSEALKIPKHEKAS